MSLLRWILISLLASFVGLVSLCAAKSCSAAELTQEQARGIYIVAYGQFHGPPSYLERMPTVNVVAPARLCELADQPAGCLVRGLYQQGAIYVSAALDFSTVEDASVLLHEFVHYLQELKRGPVLSLPETEQCAEALAREHEAYRIQAEVLYKAGKAFVAQGALRRARSLRCPAQG